MKDKLKTTFCIFVFTGMAIFNFETVYAASNKSDESLSTKLLEKNNPALYKA